MTDVSSTASSSRNATGFGNTGSQTNATYQGSEVASSFSPLINLFAVISNCLLVNEVERVHDQNIAIAESYYETALADYQFWNQEYRPRMLDIAQSVIDPLRNPVILADYPGTVGSSSSRAHKDADLAWFASRRITSKYNVGAMKWADVKNLEMRHNGAVSLATFGQRYEDVRAEMFDERRIARIIEIMNIGIDAGGIASAGLASAVSAVAEQNMDKVNSKRALVSSTIGAIGAGVDKIGKLFMGGG